MQSLEKLEPLGLLLLRIALGVIFIFHGYPKITHTHEAMESFAHMGFPAFFAYASGIIEFFGGCLLIAGLFTRIAGLLIAAEMAVALIQVHKIFHHLDAVNAYQLPLALAAGAFALATAGPGIVSLDQAIYGEKPSPARKSKKKAKNHA